MKFQDNPSNGCGIKNVNGRRRTDRQTDDGRQGDLITSARELAELKIIWRYGQKAHYDHIWRN